MIQGAENLAKMYDVSRELQDEFAYRSHQLTAENEEWKRSLRKYISPITVKGAYLTSTKV